ncbi:ABC transporter ATP-binding protein [Streptomyces sp. MZ04]|uniref:ABC transporter ATP-binding protein n=1 Tax=Streptomyces sp. MZ04 TaxID=2559236 RepID=UPI00107E741E|nr:ABC transporter ATP-binding protein [Streptomyces sp. MZ04]TGB15137.1 ABC transporter ATP-binding protein [Streptomyces sp. MZ04]
MRTPGGNGARRWLRTGALMLGIGWETGPFLFLGFVLVGLAGSLGPLMFALGLRPLVDGLYRHHTAPAVTGAIVCSAALLLVVSTPAAQNWITARIRQRSIMVMQRRILVAGSSAPGLAHFERAEFWERLQQLKRNFSQLLMGMANALVLPLVAVQLLVIAGVLAQVSPLLALLPAVALPAALLTQRAERMRLAADERAAADRRGLEHLADVASNVSAAKEIRMFGMHEELVRRHRELSARVERSTEPAAFRAYGVGLAGWLIFALSYLGAAALTIRAASEGRVSPGDVALTLSITAAVVAAAVRVTEVIGLLKRATVVSDDYHWLAEQLADSTPDGPTRALPARLEHGIELRGISFSYPGKDTAALQSIDLSLPAGSVVAVVGENGAGKTTLVKLLTRMYRPTEGSVFLDDVDLMRVDHREYRSRITAGFQDFVRFELLARECVGVGDLPAIDDEERVRGALGDASADFVGSLAHGLATQLGTRWDGGTDLSGGEWQKLAMARAMMRRDPLLVVYDEPTASLDPQTEHALFERIARSGRRPSDRCGITLLISHRFSTVRMADLIVVLEKGRIREQGSHEELVAANGLYAQLYSLQARAYR